MFILGCSNKMTFKMIMYLVVFALAFSNEAVSENAQTHKFTKSQAFEGEIEEGSISALTEGNDRNSNIQDENSPVFEKNKASVDPLEKMGKLSDKADLNLDAVRLETIDMDSRENSSSSETKQMTEGTGLNASLSELNATINSTINPNSTTKIFPKRVKCTQRFRGENVNMGEIKRIPVTFCNIYTCING